MNHRACSFALAIGTCLAATSAFAQHPLDPLNETEILAAAGALLDGGAARPGAIFQSIELREPPKDELLSWRPGDRLRRAATVYYRQDKRSFRSVVNLRSGRFSPPVEIPVSRGQLGLTIQEVSDFAFLMADRLVIDALAKRGLRTAEDRANVFVTPLTSGSFGLPEEARRIVKAQLYYTPDRGINLYARPIEGLQVIADLDDQLVLEVLDSGVVPLPTDSHDFDEATVAARYGLRDAMRPIRILQPEGVNFAFDGNFVTWQKWRFHLRFERRRGLVISLATYDGRSVLYQGALSEIFVPYQDPDDNWFYRTYMDAGEFGFGLLTSPLALGLDVPENAVLRDALVAAAIPDPDLPVIPLPLQSVVGVFERVTGNPAWRHFELFSGGLYEGRAEVELVVRAIAQVGNYDYAIDWIFTQHGAIRVDVALTGIDAPKAVRSTTVADATGPADTAHGALVAPNLVAPHHSHHFNFRLDLDVDGTDNSFAVGHLEVQQTSGSNPRKSVWALEEHLVDDELGARRGEDHEVWRVLNPARTNASGYPTSFILESHGTVEPLLDPADYRRASFIEHNLWVTAYRADEQFAAGETPNQHPGRPGLPQYVRNNESLVGRDLVLWHTVGFHHVTSAEDFPVLPRHHGSFELKPANFFDRNPALDLRRAPFESSP